MNDAVSDAPAMLTFAVIDAEGTFRAIEEHAESEVIAQNWVSQLPPEPRVALAWAWIEELWHRCTEAVAVINADGLFERVEDVGKEAIDAIDTATRVRQLPPDPRVAMAWAWREGRWMRRAALLDADGVFLMIDEVDPSTISSLHVPQVFECDLPPKRYRWVADQSSSVGGSFHPIPRPSAEQKFTLTEPLPAVAFFFLRVWASRMMVLPPVTEKWLDGYVHTMDFVGYRDAPEVIAFINRNEGASA